MACSNQDDGYQPRSRVHQSRVRPAIALIAMMFANSSCAINDLGVAKVHRYENDTCYVLGVEAWGGYLSTSSLDAGLTIGYAKRLYVFPKSDPRHRTGAQPITLGLGTASALHGSAAQQPTGDEVAVFADSMGVMFSGNRFGVDLMIGARSQAMLAVPNSADIELLINYDGSIQPGLKVCAIGEAP